MSSAMVYGFLADAVVVLHLLFIVFVVSGGLLVLFWPKAAWAHIPCVLWGVMVELTGMICPLTPLENVLRRHAGRSDYSGDFVMHYIEPVIYLEGLTRELQIVLGIAAACINLSVYAAVFHIRKWKNFRNRSQGGEDLR